MAGMTIEIELKFRISAGRLDAVRRAVATRTARTLPMAAIYLDSADQGLAQARVALRLRREGAVWVQTLKAEGANDLQRLEHNVALGDAAETPAWDIARHQGSEAGARLCRVLADAPATTLGERYATDIVRTRRVLRSGGARIELALDEGWIRAGKRRLAVCELEFELLSGPPQALLDLAARWVDRFELVLDMRSKSERGHLLAAGRWASPAARAEPAPLHKRDSPAQAFAAVLGAALRPLLRQASLLADADLVAQAAGAPEHLHQWRVSLRRLRTVLAVFGADNAASALAPALAALFKHSAEQRDQDVLAARLWPALRAAGAPWLAWPPLDQGLAAVPLDGGLAACAEPGAAPSAEPGVAPGAAPFAGPGAALGAALGTQPGTQPGAEPGAEPGAALCALLATPAVQRLWLALLGAAQPPAAAGQPADANDQPQQAPARPQAADGAAPGVALKPLWRLPLDRLLRQVRREAARFDQLGEAQRHRLRRRIKGLRYALESTAALWPAPALARMRQPLRQAQDLLGELNDCVVALARYREWAELEPRAWFAVGWLSAHSQALLPPCTAAMARLAKQPASWRRR